MEKCVLINGNKLKEFRVILRRRFNKRQKAKNIQVFRIYLQNLNYTKEEEKIQEGFDYPFTPW